MHHVKLQHSHHHLRPRAKHADSRQYQRGRASTKQLLLRQRPGPFFLRPSLPKAGIAVRRGTGSRMPLSPRHEYLQPGQAERWKAHRGHWNQPHPIQGLGSKLKRERGQIRPIQSTQKYDWTFQKHRSNYPAKGAQTQPWPVLPPTRIPSPSGELAKVLGSTQHTARTFTSGVASSVTLQEPASNTNKERAAVKTSRCQQHTVCSV